MASCAYLIDIGVLHHVPEKFDFYCHRENLLHQCFPINVKDICNVSYRVNKKYAQEVVVSKFSFVCF